MKSNTHSFRISRKWHRLSDLGFTFSAFALLFLSSIGATYALLVSLVVFVASSVGILLVNRCPHCGTSFRGFYWSKSAGYCCKCGKKLLFDDEKA